MGTAPPIGREGPGDASLAERVRRGDAGAVARALTVVENDPEGGAALLAALAGGVGRAHRVGVTGPPGAGKSTLVGALAALWRRDGRRVGVLAVDPTSPFTGGAILGDRIRMGAVAGDPGVFIRSLATRGALGGLSAATQDAADVLDAAGFDPVLVETVGVGQAEIDVAQATDTTVVVVAPGSGDEVQAMKAGLLEIADVVVVNQADRDGADKLVASLESAYEVGARAAPPVLRTVATAGEGVEALRGAVEARARGGEALAARRTARARARVRALVDGARARAWWPEREAALGQWADAVAAGRATAAWAAARLAGGAGPEEVP
jgi:LAO/AO transport system kinase